ncbi:MAG TPA: arylsulfatase [Rhodopirellula sp.]|nr:MAG: arylsulfatase [Saprospirales bacterium TMED214]HBV65598.1 arylsulfatase [Rhodopirellula sp.]
MFISTRCLLASLFLSGVAWGAEDRPNIVVVLCDDLGYGDLECYGHPVIKTPHLNELAETGMLFTDFYSTAPVCSPSRVGLLTGRSPNRAGVYDWIPEAKKATQNRRELVHMRASEITIAKLLKDAGYQTCMAGKWHCNSEFNNERQPQPGDFGFDHWLATQNNASPSHRHPRNYVRNGDEVGLIEDFSCQIVVDEAITWLKTCDSDRPFFIYAAFHEPHEPIESPPALVETYVGSAKNRHEAQYFANVANVDAAVGELLAGLEKLNRRDNTLIVFTSDNGPETLKRYGGAVRSYGRPGPLRGMKLHTTDAGFRVAGIMNWKGRIRPAGKPVSTPLSALDLLPTFCALANAKAPSHLILDGTNFLPVLDGKQLVREKPLVWVYFNALNDARVAMRDGRWKVLAKLNGGKLAKLQNVTADSASLVRDAKLTDIEVYDLGTDIGESNNIAAEDPARTARLKATLEQQYRELVQNSHAW